MNCHLPNKNAIDNTRSFLQELGAIDENLRVLDLPLFLDVVSQLNRDANISYGVQGNLWEVDPTNNRFAIPNIQLLSDIDKKRKELGLYDEQLAGYILDQTSIIPPDNMIQYDFRVINALYSNKVREPKIDNLQGFYNDVMKQGISNQQLDILKDSIERLKGKSITKQDLITDLLTNISYSVEINIAELNQDAYRIAQREEIDYEDAIMYANTNKKIPTAYYSNLTVPGGTNGSYIEANIETPMIVPSIQSHAQFKTDNTIGWMRADEKQNYQEKDIDNLIEIMKKSGILEVNCG